MSDNLDRLKSALADRYAIQEKLGEGGMATVYLAEDLKHHRKVAVTRWHRRCSMRTSTTSHSTVASVPCHPVIRPGRISESLRMRLSHDMPISLNAE